MGRDVLVGIATVYRKECRCAGDITQLTRQAGGPTRTYLQGKRVIFAFEQWRSHPILTHLRRQRKSKTIPVLPI
jgi:hypothetical protein